MKSDGDEIAIPTYLSSLFKMNIFKIMFPYRLSFDFSEL